VKFLDYYGTEQTLSLSVRDQKRLFDLTYMLFAEDNFAYTLLGSKPVSWACYKNPLPFVDCSTCYTSLKGYNHRMRAGWKAWIKYQDLFPSTNLWSKASLKYPGSVSIFILNEQSFINIINENKEDFQDVLKREIIDPVQLLKEARETSLIDTVLQEHQALIGIVLGYGRNNSWEFHKRSQKMKRFYDVWNETEDQQHESIQTRRGATDIEDCLLLESCPSFAGYPNSDESIALKKEYLLTQREIVDYYKNKDFLEATLSLLAGFRPKQTH